MYSPRKTFEINVPPYLRRVQADFKAYNTKTF